MVLKMMITSYLANLMLFKISQTTTMQRLLQGRYVCPSLFSIYVQFNCRLICHLQICEQATKDWTKAIQNEWKLLQRDLPGRYILYMTKQYIIFMRLYVH
jgi:hypothetical protein